MVDSFLLYEMVCSTNLILPTSHDAAGNNLTSLKICVREATCIIPPFWKADAGGLQVKSSLDNMTRGVPKKGKKKGAGDVVQSQGPGFRPRT